MTYLRTGTPVLQGFLFLFMQYKKVQPLLGCFVLCVVLPQFHWGLLMLNTFGVGNNLKLDKASVPSAFSVVSALYS